ncbi:PTS transporter subunit EIIC [Enterobacter mori]
MRDVAKAYSVDRDAVDARFIGLNHLIFADRIKVQGQDRTDDFIEKLAQGVGRHNLKNIPDVGLPAEFIRALRLYPLSYLKYYYLSREMVEHELDELKHSGTRGEQSLAIEKSLFCLYRDTTLCEKPEALSARGGALYSDTACSIISSIYNNKREIHIVNVPNQGATPDLPDTAVIETNAMIDASGAHPLRYGPLPRTVRGLIQSVKAFEELTVEAAVTGIVARRCWRWPHTRSCPPLPWRKQSYATISTRTAISYRSTRADALGYRQGVHMNHFLENQLVPIMMKIGNNVILVAVRNGIAFTLPFIIAGSVFLIVANLPIPGWSGWIGQYADLLSVPVQVTFGAIGLIAAIGISYNLARHYGLDGLSCVCITVAVFLLSQIDEHHRINVDNFGASGLFSAIILSVITVYIVRFFIQRKIYITLPDGVPPAVLQSFVSLAPAFLCLVLIWFVRVILKFDINAFFTLILSPLVSGLDTLPGMLVLVGLISLLWCCGIHGTNVLSGITSPIFLKFIAENTEAYLSHQPIPHISAEGFYTIFICSGGSGATLGLGCVP